MQYLIGLAKHILFTRKKLITFFNSFSYINMNIRSDKFCKLCIFSEENIVFTVSF